MNVNIQVATLFEATPIIRELELTRSPLPGLSQFYRSDSDNVVLWISGIGKDNLVKNLAKIKQLSTCNDPYTYWINIGIAGSLDRTVPMGSLFEIHSISSKEDLNSESIALNTHPLPSVDIGKLITYNEAVSDSSQANNFNKTYTLVDMEAYHWANALVQKYRVPVSKLKCFKIVSDLANGDRIDFRAFAPNYDHAIESLITSLKREVKI